MTANLGATGLGRPLEALPDDWVEMSSVWSLPPPISPHGLHLPEQLQDATNDYPRRARVSCALPEVVTTPITNRRRRSMQSPEPTAEADASDEDACASTVWFSPARRRAAPASPSKVARCTGPSTGGADCGDFLRSCALRPFPEFFERIHAQTPEPKSKASAFTPPPAPCAEQKQRQLDEDVKAALLWNSVPLLSLSLLRGARGACECRSRFDHSIHEAVNQHHVGALEFLLQHGPKDLIDECCGGLAALHRAVRLIRKEDDVGYQMAELLLAHGARHDLAAAGTGNTPLHEAAANVSLAATSLLLRHGADPNAANVLGRTPLHVACRRTLFAQDNIQDGVVEALLAQRADPTRFDNAGLRPLDHAENDGPASLLGIFAPGAASSCSQQLIRAERWLTRRPALLVRMKGDRGGIVRRLPDALFEAVTRFL
eukprot:gb/GFBE01029038.1/.p1 GENE.gb/GFBE01029038.1/~~gb/GFBE01029038.1/.p1  ORF type:complete len:430 (+),score=54.30 gb/GFBE01029038.1/:1-1290(+)